MKIDLKVFTVKIEFNYSLTVKILVLDCNITFLKLKLEVIHYDYTVKTQFNYSLTVKILNCNITVLKLKLEVI